MHFICHCHDYERYRNELYLLAYNVYENSNFYDLADMGKFVFILSSGFILISVAYTTFMERKAERVVPFLTRM